MGDDSPDHIEIDLNDARSSRVFIEEVPQLINQNEQEVNSRPNYTFSDSLNNVIRGFMPLVDHGGASLISTHGSLTSRIQNITPISLRSLMSPQDIEVSPSPNARQNSYDVPSNENASYFQRPSRPYDSVPSNDNTPYFQRTSRPNYSVPSNDNIPYFQRPSRPNDSPNEVLATSPPSFERQESLRNPHNRYREQLQQTPEYIQLRNNWIRYAPFYLIVLIKFVYDHRQGLVTFATLFIAFSYSNNVVKEELGKQGNRSIFKLLTQMACTVVCVIIVTLLFDNGALLNNLTFSLNHEDPLDMWNLLWLVCLTDFVLKLVTVDFKIIVTSLPAKLLPFKSRGKIYLFIEATSQLYRSILPIHPWLFYLTEIYGNSDKNMGLFLSVCYVFGKGIDLLFRTRFFKQAFVKLMQSVNLGSKPSSDQLQSAGEFCPICQDNYTTPVRLNCGHIFCENCVAVWLDREHTCPLCRAKVTDDPSWRDGSTTYFIQVY